jgi:hypothetical protein
MPPQFVMIIAAAVAARSLARGHRPLASRKIGRVKTVAREDLFCNAQKTPTIAKDYLGRAMETLLAFPRVQ